MVSRDRLNELLPVLNVIPITSRKSSTQKIFPNEVLLKAAESGLKVDSIALCYQIRTLDKSRLERKIGEITDSKLREEIVQALRFQLDI